MAALWINSRSAPPICFSVSPHFIRAFPVMVSGTQTQIHSQYSSVLHNEASQSLPRHKHIRFREYSEACGSVAEESYLCLVTKQ